MKCELAEVAKNIIQIKNTPEVSKAGLQRSIPACGEFQRSPEENALCQIYEGETHGVWMKPLSCAKEKTATG